MSSIEDIEMNSNNKAININNKKDGNNYTNTLSLDDKTKNQLKKVKTNTKSNNDNKSSNKDNYNRNEEEKHAYYDLIMESLNNQDNENTNDAKMIPNEKIKNKYKVNEISVRINKLNYTFFIVLLKSNNNF